MRLVPDPLLDVGEVLGPAVDALGVGEEVVGLGLGLGEEVVGLGLGLGLGEEVVGLGLGLGLGEEVVGLVLGDVSALRLGEMLTLWLGDKLAMALWIAPPQPAVRHTVRMAAKRKKLRE